MKIFYIALVVLTIYSLGTFIRIKYTLYTANLSDIVQHDKTFVTSNENGNVEPVRYIAAGDSTALGEGATVVENTYTYRVAQALSEKSTVAYKNVAVRGARTQDIIDNQLKEIIKFNPDVITISVGANDVNHLNNPEKTFENLKIIAQELEKQTKAQIYLTNIPILDKAGLLPYLYRKYLSYQTNKINSLILTLENDRLHIVDIYNFGWNKYPDIQTTFAKDKFHPNDEGYLNWTHAFLDRMWEHLNL
jgi:acyl-CoA thioesterase I